MTKLDDTSKFPQILLDEDYFILHLGEGRHKFVKCVSDGFHIFEKVTDDSIFDWKYRKSILNEFDTSKSNILSVLGDTVLVLFGGSGSEIEVCKILGRHYISAEIDEK